MSSRPSAPIRHAGAGYPSRIQPGSRLPASRRHASGDPGFIVSIWFGRLAGMATSAQIVGQGSPIFRAPPKMLSVSRPKESSGFRDDRIGSRVSLPSPVTSLPECAAKWTLRSERRFSDGGWAWIGPVPNVGLAPFRRSRTKTLARVLSSGCSVRIASEAEDRDLRERDDGRRHGSRRRPDR